MANFCFLCGNLCIYLLLLIRSSIGFSSRDYYLYSVGSPHHRSEHSLGIELLTPEDTHTYQKRDAADLLDLNHHSHEDTGGIVSTVHLPPIFSTTIKSTLTPQKIDRLKITKLTQPKLNTTITQVDLESKIKNLGVNGTGQKKYYPATRQPPLIHVPENVTVTELKKIIFTTAKPVSTSETAKITDTYSQLSDEVDVGDDYINHTLSEHNITTTKTDAHQYYNSTFVTGPEVGKFYWVNMTNRTDAKTNDLLSNSHRRAATIRLSFEFPFYGHLIKNVTIATGGFLYTGEYVHSWLAATQYIAPLMANFDTSMTKDSFIKYVDNGTAFTVQWENVVLQDRPNDGQFTFQVTLLKNGDIVFVYQNVPLLIKDIKNDHHPVKVGLSDAYITDKTIFLVRRKTIYEYHRVNFAKEDIRNWTVIYLKALPTCLDSTDCEGCLTQVLPGFDCVWCPKVNKCSNGFDRHRQDWMDKGCDSRNVSKSSMCHLSNEDLYTYHHDLLEENESEEKYYGSALENHHRPPPEQVGVSGILAILFLIVMVCGLSIWILYAYRNPHTTSGQMLIRYRPSQWRWRRGEARYTAATIHM